MAEFLLEIGCEEIPAGWLPDITKELQERFSLLATTEYLEPQNPEAHSTPRRLVLRADVLKRQPDRIERIRGPALDVAKDQNGNWTKAAEGFSRRHGISTADLVEDVDPSIPLPLPQKVYVWANKPVQGESADRVLSRVIASLFRSLSFPKRMRWDAWLDDGKGAFPFGRPIRWLIALLDGSIVPFQIYGLVNGAKGDAVVLAGNTTRGHRFFSSKDASFRVTSFDSLRQGLANQKVVLHRVERVSRIEESLRSGLTERQLEIKGAPYLKGLWADLVEHPWVVFGEIPMEFRRLPLDVVATVLVHHQKYIPTGPRRGGVSGFAAVAESDGRLTTNIVKGMERVVLARLRDASFFYEEDLKRPLAERVDDLNEVTFHQKLGSYKEKTQRLVAVVDAMNELRLLTNAVYETARAAARLCKADLTTLMVREFTELQGIIGGEYLRKQGTPSAVAEAVRWHYFPVSIDPKKDPSGLPTGPSALPFCVVSLADRLDTLAGYFGLGLAPTGSSDPFGLRRAAQGVIRILLEFWQVDATTQRPNLRQLAAAAIDGLPPRLEKAAAEVQRELEDFLLDRMAYVLEASTLDADESQQDNVRTVLGTEHPVGVAVAAALGAQEPDALDDPLEALSRFKALWAVRAQSYGALKHLGSLFKRISNILADQTPSETVDVALFDRSKQVEMDLYSTIRELSETRGSQEDRLRALLKLRDPIDRFFDPNIGVFVMDENVAVRKNRLALLAQARRLFYRIADISKLGG